jgi:hypothetical protein
MKEEITHRLRAIIKQNGGPQKLSRRIHRTERCVYFWREGEKLPDALALAELGRLGVDLNYLLLGRRRHEVGSTQLARHETGR